MGWIGYKMKELMNQRDKKGRKSLTAQQMAVMTREYGQNALKDYRAEDSEDEVGFDDQTSRSKKARWFGLFDWVGGLFSEDIFFTFKGTQIKGKDKHQVRGGAVPLFDGVILDLTPASMVGEIQGERQSVKQSDRKRNTKAKLVVSPANLDRRFIREHFIETFEISAPKNGEAETFSAEIKGAIIYSLQNQATLEAKGAELDMERVKLIDPKIVQGQDKIEYKTVEIDGTGIHLGEAKEAGNGTNVENGGKAESEGGQKKETLFSKIEDMFSNFEFGLKNEASGDRNSQKDLLEKEKDKPKDMKGRAANFMSHAFYDLSRTGWFSQDSAAVGLVNNFVNNGEKSAGSGGNGTQIANLAENAELLAGLGENGELPADFGETDEDAPSNHVKLEGAWPIIPGLNFKASLKPTWRYGFKAGWKLTKGEKPKLEVTERDGRISVSCPDIMRHLILKASLSGNMAAELLLALNVGLGYLGLDAGLFARGGLKGSLPGLEATNTFGTAELDIPIKIGAGGIRMKGADLCLTFNTGLAVFGSVGTMVGATFLNWDKELWSYTFGRWEPLKFIGRIELHKKTDGKLDTPHSWECRESTFSFSFFKQTIEKSEKWGIKIDKSNKLELLMKENKITKDTIADLHRQLEEIEEMVSKGGQGGTENSPAYEDLKKQLRKIQNSLSIWAYIGKYELDLTNQEVKEYTKDGGVYQTNLKRAEERINKHRVRKQRMEKWGGQIKDDDERNLKASEYYKNELKGKGALNNQEKAREEQAELKFATKERLIAYEKERMRMLGKKYDKRLDRLRKEIAKIPAGISEEKKKEKMQELLALYRRMGGGDISGFAARYAGKERIMSYERGREVTYRRRHLDRHELLQKKANELGISKDNLNEPNKDFAEYYHKELNAKRFFTKEVLLDYHQNGTEILAYEEKCMKEDSGKYLERIEMLKAKRSIYDMFDETDFTEKREENLSTYMKEAQNEYRKMKGGLGQSLQMHLNIAKAASKTEILIYEYDKVKENNSKKTSNKVKNIKNALEGQENQSGWNQLVTKSYYNSWLKKNLEKDNINLFQEVLTPELLMKFVVEQRIQDRAYYKVYNKELKKGHSEETARINAQSIHSLYIAQYSFLDGLIKQAEGLEGEEREAMIRDGVHKFVSLHLVDKDGKLNKDGEAIRFQMTHDGGTLYIPEQRDAVLERILEENEDVHKTRLKSLCAFMGVIKEGEELPESVSKEDLKAKAGNSSRSDAEVWDYYRSLKAGRGFADYFAQKERKNGYSIDEMLRYEEYEAREHSKKNGLKELIKQRKMKKKEGKEALSQEELSDLSGELTDRSHYERYLELQKAVRENKKDDDIVKLYRSMGGGDGYVGAMTGRGMLILETVTPKEILDYEGKWVGERGMVHSERMKKLLELDKNLSSEEFYDRYREMVLGENVMKQARDELTKGGSVRIGFDESVRAEEVLTPELILLFEEKRRKEILGKHEDRLNRLQQNDVTDQNALEIYRGESDGGKRFLRKNSSGVSKEKNQIGYSEDYHNILDYEDARSEYFEDAKREMEKELQKIQDNQKELEGKVKQAEEDYEKAKAILDKYEQNPPYKSQNLFLEFINETTGTEIQNSVDKAADIPEAVKESEEQRREQSRRLDDLAQGVELDEGFDWIGDRTYSWEDTAIPIHDGSFDDLWQV